MKVDLLLIGLYCGIGSALTLWTNAALRNPDKMYTYFQGREEYTPEGQRRRQIVIRYWLGAGVLLVAALVLL